MLSRDSLVFHMFTGLDPTRPYSLRATALGGLPGIRNRWTLCALIGADTFTSAHTASVLTSAEAPADIAPNEAAMSTGDNATGDMMGWDEIMPGHVFGTTYGYGRRDQILRQVGRNPEAVAAFQSALQALDTLPPARRNIPATLELETSIRAALAEMGVRPAAATSGRP